MTAIAGAAWQTLAFALIAFAAVLVAAPSVAHAHAVLVDSDPRADAVLRKGPDSVGLTFDQPVRLVSLRVIAIDGGVTPVPTGTSAPAETIRVTLDRAFPAGTYVLAYRGISTDGHPVQGTLGFAVGAAVAPQAPQSLAHEGDGWLAAAIGLRFVNGAILAAVAGGFLYRIFVAPPGALAARTFTRLACIGAAASLLDVGVRAGFAFDAPAAALFDADLWRAGLDQTAGRARLAAAYGFLLLALAWHGGGRLVVGSLGVALALAGVVWSSHTTAPAPRWFGTLAIAVHVAAAIYWVGSFAPLLGALERRADEAKRALDRFARGAPVAIAALILSGAALLAVQSGGEAPPPSGIYVLAIALKLALVAVMLGLAAQNRWRTVPMWPHAQAASGWRLSRNICFEGAMALGVLGFAAVLAFSPPPRVVAEAGRAGELTLRMADVEAATVAVAGATVGAVVTLEPGRAGPNALAFVLTDADELPLAAAAATVSLTPASGGSAARYDIRASGPGAFRLDRIELAAPGVWRLTIRAEGAHDPVELEAEVTIR
jgi:copper transport protein